MPGMSGDTPRSYTDQLAILEARGLGVDDKVVALRWLCHLNYYRFKLYASVFWQSGQSRYVVGSSFADVLWLYHFDQALRELVLSAIKCVEVSVRSRLAYEVGHRSGPHAHLDTCQFRHVDRCIEMLNGLRSELRRSREDFLAPYRPSESIGNIPVWVAVEVASFGVISKMLSGQASVSLRQAVADTYGMDERVLCAAMHHLNVVRNTAAHHGRLWNRRFNIELSLPRKKPAGLWVAFAHGEDRNKLYNTLVIILHMIRAIDPSSSLPRRIRQHMESLPVALRHHMGIPLGWEEQPMWCR
jgi:abortive infection bacteriophage resistance protein